MTTHEHPLQAFELREQIHRTEAQIRELDRKRGDATVAMDAPRAQYLLTEISRLNRVVTDLQADYDATPPGLGRLALEAGQAKLSFERGELTSSEVLRVQDRLAAAERRRAEVLDGRELGTQLTLIPQGDQPIGNAQHSYFVSGRLGLYKAHCTCGWVSEARSSSHQAVRSGAGHLRGARAAAVRTRLHLAS